MRDRRIVFIFTFAFLAVLSSLVPGRAEARRFELRDLRHLTDVSDPQISPDGKSIAVIVTHPDFQRDLYVTSLVLVDVATRRQRRLAPQARDISFPRWSASSDVLAFLATTGPKDREIKQVFAVRVEDGRVRRVTHTVSDVSQFAWRPDGHQIAYVTSDSAPRKSKFDDAFVVGSNDYMTQAAPTPSHIWLVWADGTHARRLTSGARGLASLQPPYTLASPISWSADGKSIAFARLPSAYEDEANRQDIGVVDIAARSVRKLAAGAYQMMPLFAPSGSRVAYVRPREGDYNQIGQIFQVPADGGASIGVTTALDRNVLWATWMPGSHSLLLGADDGTRTAMWIQPLGTPARKLDLGSLNWQTATQTEFDNWIPVSVSTGGALAFTASETRKPVELYYMRSWRSKPVRLTDFNRDIAALALGRSESVQWQGPDGFREDGVLTYPPQFARGKRYPLVLVIHGGPIATSSRTFDELAQLLAARDFLVFRPNYRGSDGLGNAYERAIYRDAGDGPGKDVMAGVAAVEARGYVDTSRIAVSGWSYGGFMTSWLIGHYHMWKAAVSGAAVNDWFVDYATADDATSDRLQLGTSPWTAGGYEEFRRQSPITYAQAITTPTLIMCDTGDVRVPIPESYEMFRALRDNHVPVQFVAYPVSGHLPADPVRNADIDRRWVDWIARYLK